MWKVLKKHYHTITPITNFRIFGKFLTNFRVLSVIILFFALDLRSLSQKNLNGSGSTNGKRKLTLPRDKIFYGNGCKIMKILTTISKFCSVLHPFQKNMNLPRQESGNLYLESRCHQKFKFKVVPTVCMVFCLAKYAMILGL